MRRLSILACAAACGFAAIALGEPAPTTLPAATQPSSRVVRGDGFAIRLPADWRDNSARWSARANVQLDEISDGPFADDVGDPLRLGITVQRQGSGSGWPTTGADVYARGAFSSWGRTRIGEATTRAVTLADGTPGVVLVTYFLNHFSTTQPLRHRLEQRLFVSPASDRSGWMVTGSIECAARSQLAAPDGAAAAWLEAHVLSFVFDAERQDLSPLPPMPAFAERRKTPTPARRPDQKGLP